MANDMLDTGSTTDASGDNPFYNPKPINSLRDVNIEGKTWKYQWLDERVEIVSPEGEEVVTSAWTVLEISKAEFKQWSRNPDSGLIITAKDISDYIKETVLKRSSSMRTAKLSRATL